MSTSCFSATRKYPQTAVWELVEQRIDATRSVNGKPLTKARAWGARQQSSRIPTCRPTSSALILPPRGTKRCTYIVKA
jgi:hypothetical protein